MQPLQICHYIYTTGGLTMAFTATEWIGIAQAFILLLTAIVIAWYTIETARIRKQTSLQNTLLAEQLRLMQAGMQRELDKEASFIKPMFTFGGGTHSTDHASVEFHNKGGTALKLATKPSEGLVVTVNPTRFLNTNDRGNFQIRATHLNSKDKWFFELTYEDMLHNQYSSRLYYKPQTGIFEEET
jgi:hypothetical protein